MQRLNQILAAMDAFQPDVVLASGQHAVWLAAVACRRRKVAWVAVAHGSELGVRNRWEQAANRRAYGRADALVAVSRFTMGLVRDAGIVAGRDAIILNGADDDRFRVDEQAGAAFR